MIKNKKSIIKNLVKEFIKGKCPIVPYVLTYAFRKELLKQGYLFIDSVKYWPAASRQIHGLSFIINHGNFKNKNTFVYEQMHCITEDIIK